MAESQSHQTSEPDTKQTESREASR